MVNQVKRDSNPLQRACGFWYCAVLNQWLPIHHDAFHRWGLGRTGYLLVNLFCLIGQGKGLPIKAILAYCSMPERTLYRKLRILRQCGIIAAVAQAPDGTMKKPQYIYGLVNPVSREMLDDLARCLGTYGIRARKLTPIEALEKKISDRADKIIKANQEWLKKYDGKMEMRKESGYSKNHDIKEKINFDK